MFYNLAPIFNLIIFTEGETPTLERLHSDEFKAEYNKLAEAELEEIVARHSEDHSNINRQRVTAKARVIDVSNTCQSIQQLVSPYISVPYVSLMFQKIKGLNMRVGVEGFFCIFRNTPNYHMEPKWFFTSQALMDYMRIAVPVGKPWDFAYVAAKLEAFAIAGCDPISKSSPRLLFLLVTWRTRPSPNL